MIRKIPHILLMLHLLSAGKSGSAQNVAVGVRTPGRLIVLADMGNERDEEQQMIHLLMYSNEVDLEGLIAVSGIFLNSSYAKTNPAKSVLHPELFYRLAEGYSLVYENLKKHADNWPSPEHLKSIICTGQKDYGMADTGEGKSSPGSELIIKAVTKNDPRPVYIVVNAGSNTLAQAIMDYQRSHSASETDAFIKKLIVFENGSQDDAGAWIVSNYPQIHWIRSNYQTYAYAGPGLKISKDLGPYAWPPFPFNYEGQAAWSKENIQTGHGALGALYPDRILREQFEFLEGGGTAPWLGLMTGGLSDPLHPGWGGWSGRFTSEKQDTVWSRHKAIAERERTYAIFRLFADSSDQWTDPRDNKEYNDVFTPLQRWRKDQFDDFKSRMDWCVQPFDSANHNPVAVVGNSCSRKIIKVKAKPGQRLKFDASPSFDPDKNQKLTFSWWVYPEAGTYKGRCELKNRSLPVLQFYVPGDAAGKEIHLILDVSDNSPIAVMHDYRRIVINVSK
jgi:hypothetical protein